MFFFIAFVFGSIGPGSIASAALIGPMAMTVAAQTGIPAFLMAIMVANGASAGSLSPITPTGVVVNGIVAKIGLPPAPWTIYLNNLAAHTAVALAGYLLLGGWKLLSRPAAGASAGDAPAQAFEPRHWLTLAAIVALIVGVVFFGLNVGMGAFSAAILLTLAHAADEGESIRSMPWKVIMMVSGVMVLVGLLEKTGGMDLFTDLLARVATPATSTAVTAFLTGLISIYSSTTGVVLPALLPTVPGLIERMGGGDAMALVSSMNVGGHLVDVSPLSTLGALCLAAAPPGTDSRALFNKLLAWGLSMTVVGAAVCWVFFGRG